MGESGQKFGSVLSMMLLVTMLAGCGGSGPDGEPASTALASPPLPTAVEPQPTPTFIAGRYTYADLVALFEYDPQQPLDVQEYATPTEEAGITWQSISFAGVAGDVVTAIMVTPAGTGPFAGVVFMHEGRANVFSHLDEAVTLARQGVVSLLVQGTWDPSPENFQRMVMRLRRAVDYLVAMDTVDSNRLGFVGHSWGAAFGGVLAGVDRRFRCYVLIAGPPYLSTYWEDDGIVPFDGIYYIGQAAPAALFFQLAEKDEAVSPEAALQYFEAASEPKQLSWYDTDHAFQIEQAATDRREWLVEQLNALQ